MYKYNKNDNMTKELVWSSGQFFPLVTGKTWVKILVVAVCLQYNLGFGFKSYGYWERHFMNSATIGFFLALWHKFYIGQTITKIMLILAQRSNK